MKRKQHWENVYETKTDHDVGWFQENPETSLKLVQKYSTNKKLPIIDVGGGNSHLTRILCDLGYSDLSVMDISLGALDRSKNRFGNNAGKVNWIESDVMHFSTSHSYQTWHDRAVFHFLIDYTEVKNYADVAAKSIAHGGYLLLGTFSLTGPKICSGLPITQYCKDSFCEIFQDKFNLIECFDDVHITPSGNPQNFIWAVFKRN